MKRVLALSALFYLSFTPIAQNLQRDTQLRHTRPLPLERAGLQAVVNRADVVAEVQVRGVTSAWETNEFGDRLIVSTVRVQVRDLLKVLNPSPLMTYRVKGGEVDGSRLRVSGYDVPETGDTLFVALRASRAGYELIGYDEASIDWARPITLDRVPTTPVALRNILRGGGR
jgi:hypothetical protein